jgi:hypothetical protein
LATHLPNLATHPPQFGHQSPTTLPFISPTKLPIPPIYPPIPNKLAFHP